MTVVCILEGLNYPRTRKRFRARRAFKLKWELLAHKQVRHTFTSKVAFLFKELPDYTEEVETEWDLFKSAVIITDNNSPDGKCLAGWASINCLALLYNAKDTASFYSGRWNTGTNPDLAFASVGPNSRLPDRRILDKFPRSQHRPSLITPPRFAMAVPSMPVKRWNFHKAKWSHYIALTNKFAKTLLPPDSLDVDAAYRDFCNTIKKAAKKTIPRGYRNNYIPCWDAECKSLYKTFLQSPQGDDLSLTATALLAMLDRKRRD